MIPSVEANRPLSFPTLSVLTGKGKEKLTVKAWDDTKQARMRRRGDDGSQLIPVDHIVDLTGPETEVKKPATPLVKPVNSDLVNMSVDDRMLVEFSNMGPRSEGRYLFGQMPPSMWCNTSLKVRPQFLQPDSLV
ncbi:unnamed protein product [Cuscuta europaea]|uniref:Uncharacterized protein n=1 Tax=Cuscuta europaea TaxID=41803 RepID=A0A9P0ZMZ2_CUSEU|nr:unnamed protein product [Cuscuta europaea]